MPKPKSLVWNHFSEYLDDKQNLHGKCKYCGITYVSNAKRMEIHLTKCNNCPDAIKESYLAAENCDSSSLKYCSDFKNKLKNKVSVLKKTKRSGAVSKKVIKPLTRLEKRALVILDPQFERKISKGQCPPKVKLETYQENENNNFSYTHSDSSDHYLDAEKDSDLSDNSNNDFDGEAVDETNESILQGIYPNWLIELEKKRAEADLSRAKAEEKRAEISAKSAEAALIQAEAIKKLADAATVQAESLVKIASLLEERFQRADYTL